MKCFFRGACPCTKHTQGHWKFARPLTTFWSQGRPIHRSEDRFGTMCICRRFQPKHQTSKNHQKSRYFTQRISPRLCLWSFQLTWRINRIHQNLGTKRHSGPASACTRRIAPWRNERHVTARSHEIASGMATFRAKAENSARKNKNQE